jgi:5-methylcytosine-specific restriction endonuclease McrA
MTKRCTQCDRELSVSSFGRRGASLKSWCKECSQQRQNEWRARTREQQRAYARKKYANDADRQRVYHREKMRARRAADPERARQYTNDYRAANREKTRATQAAWIAANPERWALLRRAVKERRRSGLATLDLDYAAILLGDPCSYCVGPAGTIDHIVAIAEGGVGDATNLTAACGRCNSVKHSRPLLLALLAIRRPA